MGERSDHPRQDEYLISQYLDGTLSDSVRGEFERRLTSETALAGLLERYRAIDGLVEAWGADVPEVDWARFESESGRRRGQLTAPRRRSGLILKLFAPLAAAAAILMVVALIRDAALPGVARPAAGRVEMIVEISRPPRARYKASDAYVSYGYAPKADEDDDTLAWSSPARPVVIAQAVVGKRVNWSMVGVSRRGR